MTETTCSCGRWTWAADIRCWQSKKHGVVHLDGKEWMTCKRCRTRLYSEGRSDYYRLLRVTMENGEFSNVGVVVVALARGIYLAKLCCAPYGVQTLYKATERVLTDIGVSMPNLADPRHVFGKCGDLTEHLQNAMAEYENVGPIGFSPKTACNGYMYIHVCCKVFDTLVYPDKNRKDLGFRYDVQWKEVKK